MNSWLEIYLQLRSCFSAHAVKTTVTWLTSAESVVDSSAELEADDTEVQPAHAERKQLEETQVMESFNKHETVKLTHRSRLLKVLVHVQVLLDWKLTTRRCLRGLIHWNRTSSWLELLATVDPRKAIFLRLLQSERARLKMKRLEKQKALETLSRRDYYTWHVVNLVSRSLNVIDNGPHQHNTL